MSPFTICIPIIQVKATTNISGRVISFAAMAMFGMLPLGSLPVGAVSQKIGAPNNIICQGVIALIIVALFSKFKKG